MKTNIAGIGVTEDNHINGLSDAHNEVFTPDSIVNEMLDETDLLLRNNGITSDSDYIDYIVLEPTCGSGNFLIRELERKLKYVSKYTGIEKEIALLRAVSSIHGIELTAANVTLAKLRMMELIETGTTSIFELEYKNKNEINIESFKLSPNMKLSIQYILDRNIQCGNCLTYKKLLINKSNYCNNIWDIEQTKINSSIISTSDTELELMLTQYDFDNETVAIRERSYQNMHSKNEVYENTSEYVKYDMIYTLNKNIVYLDDIESNDDNEEFDF